MSQLHRLSAGSEKAKREVPSVEDAMRTALAAIASLLIARLVQLPEAYWATIATLVVMQSTVGATLAVSLGRVVAAGLAAIIGALEASYFGTNLVAFTIAIFFMGLCSIALRLERTAYRYTGITLAVIVLVPHVDSPWLTALHRFIEVTIGVLVALLVAALWPERQHGTTAATTGGRP